MLLQLWTGGSSHETSLCFQVLHNGFVPYKVRRFELGFELGDIFHGSVDSDDRVLPLSVAHAFGERKVNWAWVLEQASKSFGIDGDNVAL